MPDRPCSALKARTENAAIISRQPFSDDPGGDLVAAFPLAPIENEVAYSRAIAVLDRLFLLRREKSRDESDYFRALARLAHEYECRS